MRKWIVINVFGEHPESVSTLQFIVGLVLVLFLTSAALFPVLFPILYFSLS